MRTSWIGFTGAALLSAAPAVAQDAAATTGDTAPPSAFTITGGATLISDYRFRGISQTDKHFALQGTLGVAHSSGFYIGTWGSSIDDYIANGSDQEIDLYSGYKKTINGTTIDGGLLYYYYPGGGNAKTDFFEPYINASHTFGPVMAKIGGNFSWSQHGLYNGDPNHTRSAGAYAYGELSAAIPTTGVTVTGHLGHSFVRNYITFDTHYTDWSVTAAYSWKALTFSAAYVDTNQDLFSYPLRNGHNRDISKSGFVGAVAVAF
jgi:uncharacterized protein (TIGR02001 family)